MHSWAQGQMTHRTVWLAVSTYIANILLLIVLLFNGCSDTIAHQGNMHVHCSDQFECNTTSLHCTV